MAALSVSEFYKLVVVFLSTQRVLIITDAFHWHLDFLAAQTIKNARESRSRAFINQNHVAFTKIVLFLQSESHTNLFNMSTATLQIRVEDNLKEQAIALFERLGLDLPTAIRIFLKKSVAENGVPFEIKEKPRVSANGLEAMYALNAEAIKNGKAGMTEEEIEAEIAIAHAENN